MIRECVINIPNIGNYPLLRWYIGNTTKLIITGLESVTNYQNAGIRLYLKEGNPVVDDLSEQTNILSEFDDDTTSPIEINEDGLAIYILSPYRTLFLDNTKIYALGVRIEQGGIIETVGVYKLKLNKDYFDPSLFGFGWNEAGWNIGPWGGKKPVARFGWNEAGWNIGPWGGIVPPYIPSQSLVYGEGLYGEGLYGQ